LQAFYSVRSEKQLVEAALLNPNFSEVKHEIQNIIHEPSLSFERIPGEIKGLFSSIDQLIAFLNLKLQTMTCLQAIFVLSAAAKQVFIGDRP
jgi:hypothetical protein